MFADICKTNKFYHFFFFFGNIYLKTQYFKHCFFFLSNFKNAIYFLGIIKIQIS